MLYFHPKEIIFDCSSALLSGTKDVKDIYTTLKDNAAHISGSTDIVKNQISYTLCFSLIISLISDAFSASSNQMSILSLDASFTRDFHETVMAIGNDPTIEGCMHCVRLAWFVHLMEGGLYKQRFPVFAKHSSPNSSLSAMIICGLYPDFFRMVLSGNMVVMIICGLQFNYYLLITINVGVVIRGIVE